MVSASYVTWEEVLYHVDAKEYSPEVIAEHSAAS